MLPRRGLSGAEWRLRPAESPLGTQALVKPIPASVEEQGLFQATAGLSRKCPVGAELAWRGEGSSSFALPT